MAEPVLEPDTLGVVVIGGANMDLKARSHAPILQGTSNPGRSVLAPGGVGRNIAENLARLGTRVHLVSAVGNDVLGEELLAVTAEAGVDTAYVRVRPVTTGTYAAVLDADGELVVAIADMVAADEITPLAIRAAREAMLLAGLVVLDGNPPPDALAHAIDEALLADVRVVIDPASVPKAQRIAPLLGAERPVFLVSPNRAELAALSGHPTDTELDLHAAVDALHERGVLWVWVRLGAEGSLLSGPDGGRRIDPIPGEVVDVTGAGDAMLAAFCHELLRGADPVRAARFGHAAAALTIASPDTVRRDLSDHLVRSVL